MPGAVDSIVGSNLRRLREARGLSLAELATRAKVEVDQLRCFESGEIRLFARMMYTLALSLGVPISAFFECVEADAGADQPQAQSVH